MWKLFATVLAVSDNGTIATSGFVTDYPSENSCKQTAEELFRASEYIVNGIKITFKTNAVCRRVFFPPPEQQVRVPAPGWLLR